MNKEKIIKRLNEIIFEILKADEVELNKIGTELLEIEKKLLVSPAPKKSNF